MSEMVAIAIGLLIFLIIFLFCSSPSCGPNRDKQFKRMIERQVEEMTRRGTMPIPYERWKTLDTIIERVGKDVPWYPPDPRFFDFKFEADYES